MTVQTQWGTDHLVRAQFNQDKTWVSADSIVHEIKDMRLDHVLNTLLFLERVHDQLPVRNLQETPLYQALKARVDAALKFQQSVVDQLSRPTLATYTAPPSDTLKPGIQLPTSAWLDRVLGKPSQPTTKEVAVDLAGIRRLLTKYAGTDKTLLLTYVKDNGQRSTRRIRALSITPPSYDRSRFSTRYLKARDLDDPFDGFDTPRIKSFILTQIDRIEVV